MDSSESPRDFSIANHIPQLVFHYREGICTATAFSDVRSSMEFRAGVHETTCARHIILARFLEEAPGKKYSVAVRLDMNRIFYEEMIRRFTAWYDTFPQSPHPGCSGNGVRSAARHLPPLSS